MIELDHPVYVNAFFVLMISSILALIIVIRNLRVSEIPVTALRFYNLYFIVGMIGCLVLWFKEIAYLEMTLALSLVFYVLCSMFLLIAVAECSNEKTPQKTIALLHGFILLASLLATEDADRLLFVAIYTLLAYPVVFYFSMRRSLGKRNIGNGIIALAALMVVLVALFQIYNIVIANDIKFAYGLALGASSTGFILVGIGFLTSVLVNEHKQLSLLAVKDPLTGVFNRRGMDNALNITLASARRSNNCISVIAIDIDHFKQINDVYGHEAGDCVLKEIAAVLLSLSRPSDVCSRFGGEEFCLALPETELDKACSVAERIRQTIEQLEVAYNQHRIRLTSSFGVATHCGDVDVDYLLKDADKALYAAKAQGRNRVCVSERQVINLG